MHKVLQAQWKVGNTDFANPKNSQAELLGCTGLVCIEKNVFTLEKRVQSEQLKHSTVKNGQPKEELNATEIQFFNTSGKYSYLLLTCWDKHTQQFLFIINQSPENTCIRGWL